MGTYHTGDRFVISCDMCEDTLLNVKTEGNINRLKYGTVKIVCDACRDKYLVSVKIVREHGRG